MQHAIDITTEAQLRAWQRRRAKGEYESSPNRVYVQTKQRDHWGYPSIGGGGPNATTLHYIESQGAV